MVWIEEIQDSWKNKKFNFCNNSIDLMLISTSRCSIKKILFFFHQTHHLHHHDQSWISPSGMFNIRCLKLNNTYTHPILLRFYFYFILSKWSRYFHHTSEWIYLIFTFIFHIYFFHIFFSYIGLILFFIRSFTSSIRSFTSSIHSFFHSTFISFLQPSNWQHEKKVFLSYFDQFESKW